MHNSDRYHHQIHEHRQRWQRNPHRGRVGGVCAGLADYTGLSQTLFRVLFLISLLFGGLGLWLYLILWIALPVQGTVPLSGASARLRWQLYKLGRRIARLHRSHSAEIADQAQAGYDAIRRLSPQIDIQHPESLDPDVARLALIDFPALIDQVERAGNLMSGSGSHGSSSALEQAFNECCTSLVERSSQSFAKLRDSQVQIHSTPSSELIAFRNNVKDLRQRLEAGTSTHIHDQLAEIEWSLEGLLSLPDETLTQISPVSGHEIRRIAFDYLPETLESYIKIQGPMARTHQIRDGKTGEEIFKEQLSVLNETLNSYRKALYEKDAKALLVQGHFLKDKFSPRKPSDHES